MSGMTGTVNQFLRGPLALVLAVGLIAVGLGAQVRTNTVAFFTADTNNPNNVFNTGVIQFTNTPNGVACTAGPGTTNNPAACNSLVSMTDVVPGDTKFGRLSLAVPTDASANGQVPVTVWLTTTATASSLLNTDAVTAGGLGLLVFRCYSATDSFTGALSTVADCSVAPGAGNSLYLLPVYPSASSNTVPCATTFAATAKDSTGTARQTLRLVTNTAFGTPVISTSLTTGDQIVTIAVDGPATSACTGGNIVTGATLPVGGPRTLGFPGLTNAGTPAQVQGLNDGDTDNLAVIAYLPTSSDNTHQNLNTTIQFNWKAEQRRGVTS